MSETDEHLAGVGAGHQISESIDSIVDSLDDGLAPDDLALGQPLSDLGLELGAKVRVVEDDEAAQSQPLADDHRHVAGSGCRPGGVVDRDHPADGGATTWTQRADGGFEMVTSDVVEIDVDALGCGLGQAPVDRCRLVVDGRVESGLVEQPGGLLGTPGAAGAQGGTLEPVSYTHLT